MGFSMISPTFHGIFGSDADISQVEPTVRRCLRTWLGDGEAQRRLYGDLDEAARSAALRRQAVQILGFPEEFCLEEEPFGPGMAWEFGWNLAWENWGIWEKPWENTVEKLIKKIMKTYLKQYLKMVISD